MGAWDSGLLDNDDARDLAEDFAATSDVSLVEAALAEVLTCGAGYLEAPCAQRGLAAAAIVAGDEEPGVAWPEATRAKARAVVSRVQEPASELMELWDECDRSDEWRSAVSTLAGRLGSLP